MTGNSSTAVRPPQTYYCQNIMQSWTVGGEAIGYLRLDSRNLPGVCWNNTGHLFLQSASSKPARVVLQVDTIVDGRQTIYYDGYYLAAHGEESVGCVIPGPTPQRFDRKIVAAGFAI